MSEYDIIIIGAGHNGLTCAGYLLKAGLSVLVLERRHIVGGCATTEEEIPEAPGFKFNPCAFEILLHEKVPMVRDLELTRFGLKLLRLDPVVFSPYPDGTHLLFWRDVERTCREIARYSPNDARAYPEFLAFWHDMSALLDPIRMSPPPSFKELLNLVDESQVEETVRVLMLSPKQMLDEWFEDERVKGPIAWWAAQLNTTPTDQGTSMFCSHIEMLHRIGIQRPEGGTGMLTQAMANMVTHYGGAIRTNAEVSRITIEDGRAVGVELAGGEKLRASKAVISNLDAKRVFQNLVDPSYLEAGFLKRVRNIRASGVGAIKVELALAERPRYEDTCRVGPEAAIPTMYYSPSVDYLDRCFQDIKRGELPEGPVFCAYDPSVADPTMAPPGKHTLYIWEPVPYELSNSRNWDQVKEQAADKLIDAVARFAPNVKGAIIARKIVTPPEEERRTGMIRGNYVHLDMTFDQLFSFRPLPELSRYRTPISGLYLTGAGTHPGGGVTCAPGHNTAHEVIGDLGLG